MARRYAQLEARTGKQSCCNYVDHLTLTYGFLSVYRVSQKLHNNR